MEQQEEVFTINADTSGITLKHLHQIAGIDEEKLDFFPISKRRVYCKLSANIAEEYKRFIEAQEDASDFLIQIANFKNRCLTKDFENLDDLRDSLDAILIDFFEPCWHYCDENYNVELQVTAQNEELLFTREHIITLLASTIIMRITIPLITSFIVDTKYDEETPEQVFLMYFIHIIEEMQKYIDREVDIVNKMFRLVESRVNGTEYSDMVIWNYLKNIGVNPVEFIQPLFRKMIIDIIPKLTMDENVLAFFTVVIKKQLQYLFRQNIPLSYEVVNSAIEPDEASVFDTNIAKFAQNEIYSSLCSEGVKDMIARVKRSFATDIDIDKATVNSYINKIKATKDKEILFFTFYGKYAEDYEILYSINKFEFTYLALLLSKILEKNGLNELAKIMVTNLEQSGKISVAKTKLAKKYVDSIKSSEQYKNLMETKFKSISSRFERNNTIIILLEQALKSNRLSIELEDGKEPEVVTLNNDFLAAELLRFVGFIV